MNEQQRHELSLLADGLAKVPPDKFLMNRWGRGIRDTNREGFDCGFAGCAIGWAPKFIPDCGLDFIGPLQEPKWGLRLGMHAVSGYFGIPMADADYLFSTGYYYRPIMGQILPETVAERIRDYLDRFGRPMKPGIEGDSMAGMCCPYPPVEV